MTTMRAGEGAALFTRDSSRDPRRLRAAAGGAWQGRRSAGIPPGFQGSRTPPGGDQRPIRWCRGLREGSLGGAGLRVGEDRGEHREELELGLVLDRLLDR